MTTSTITHRGPSRRIGTVIAATLAAGALAAGSFQIGTSRSATTRPLRIESVEFTAVADFSDDRRLVGFAEDVFFGEVLDSGRTSNRDQLPETDFKVKVVETIKGDAAGAVTVTQQGGYIAERNELRLMEGDSLLEAGKVYLFATRSDPKGRHFLVPGFGDVKVASKAHRDELRRRATEAKHREIRFEHNN